MTTTHRPATTAHFSVYVYDAVTGDARPTIELSTETPRLVAVDLIEDGTVVWTSSGHLNVEWAQAHAANHASELAGEEVTMTWDFSFAATTDITESVVCVGTVDE